VFKKVFINLLCKQCCRWQYLYFKLGASFQ